MNKELIEKFKIKTKSKYTTIPLPSSRYYKKVKFEKLSDIRRKIFLFNNKKPAIIAGL